MRSSSWVSKFLAEAHNGTQRADHKGPDDLPFLCVPVLRLVADIWGSSPSQPLYYSTHRLCQSPWGLSGHNIDNQVWSQGHGQFPALPGAYPPACALFCYQKSPAQCILLCPTPGGWVLSVCLPSPRSPPHPRVPYRASLCTGPKNTSRSWEDVANLFHSIYQGLGNACKPYCTPASAH